MNFDAAEVSLLVLLSVVICVEFFQSSVCPCQLRGPIQNQFSQVSFWAAQFPELFSLAGQKGCGRSAPGPDAAGWDQKCWVLAVIVTLSQLCVVRWHPQEECFIFFLVLFAISFWTNAPSENNDLASPPLLLQLLVEFILYEQPFQISSSDDAGHVHRSMIHSQRSLMEVGWKNICLIIEWLLCCVLPAWQGAEWLLVAGQEMLAALI